MAHLYGTLNSQDFAGRCLLPCFCPVRCKDSWDSNHSYRGQSLPFVLTMLVAAEDITVAIRLLQWHLNNILFFVPWFQQSGQVFANHSLGCNISWAEGIKFEYMVSNARMPSHSTQGLFLYSMLTSLVHYCTLFFVHVKMHSKLVRLLLFNWPHVTWTTVHNLPIRKIILYKLPNWKTTFPCFAFIFPWCSDVVPIIFPGMQCSFFKDVNETGPLLPIMLGG